MLIDTHCHIYDSQYGFDIDSVLRNANNSGVEKIICIGTSAEDSKVAVNFAENHSGCFASVGLHPHDAKMGEDDFEVLSMLVNSPKVVAIGELGLDYYYQNSSKEDQEKAMRYQIELALSVSKPCIFHVRDAKNGDGEVYRDFWRILDSYTGVRGVIHSFSGNKQNLEEALKRGLFLGINGIVTFTQDPEQLAVFKMIPLDRIVLETDAPYLTPTPKRGTINEPANVSLVAEFLSRLRGESIMTLSEVTTGNAQSLFGI